MNILQNWNLKLTKLDKVEAFRARIGFWFCLILIALSSVVVPLQHIADPIKTIQLYIVGASYIFTFVSGMLIVSRPGSVSGRIGLLLCLFSIIPASAYLNYGFNAPIFPLIVLFPMLGAFLIGPRGALFFLVMALTTIAVVYSGHSSGVIPVLHDYDEGNRPLTQIIIFSTVSIIALAIGVIYEKMRANFQENETRLVAWQTVQSMVVTYNHEINNPLMIAMMHLDRMDRDGKLPPDSAQKALIALERIKEVTRKIRDLSENAQIETHAYHDDSKVQMLKIS